MGIIERIQNIIGESEGEAFAYVADIDGLIFALPPSEFAVCESGEAGSWLMHQYVYLRQLEEQGLSFQIPSGFSIPSECAIHLEKEAFELLNLPKHFPGKFKLTTKGRAAQSAFSVDIVPINQSGDELPNYSVEGPLLVFSEHQKYLLSPSEFVAFQSIQSHLEDEDANVEHKNLRLIALLQKAKQMGMLIDLSQFNELEVTIPDIVSVNVHEQEDGSLKLSPVYGPGVDPGLMDARLGQLDGATDRATLRIGEQIVVLDEKRLEATQEILSNRLIDKEKAADFLKSPGAFLDASLVDLDIGFSLRVHGATEFKHGYFGDTDESGISWFSSGSEKVYVPSQLTKLIKTEEDLDKFKEQYDDAVQSGAQQLQFGDAVIDISDKDQVERTIQSIRDKINSPDPYPKESGGDDTSTEKDDAPEKYVPNIDLNDEELSFTIDKSVNEVSFDGAIDFSAYKFKPYSYQEKGIRWVLGLAEKTIDLAEEEVGKHGALLADDMGLGKTFMSLAAVKEYQALAKEKGETERPVLVVAPLSLLETWKDEVNAVYADNQTPFKDIITLQSSADLSRFKVGAGIETKQQDLANEGGKIRYSLKVGSGADRLDMPKRLVLTTYETLRDYQFSLSVIDWSFVIFDEAQRIKNPNALWTRAAKALKARFKLLATGTPVENHLGDFWCLMDTAQPGKLDSYQDFRENYIKPITSVSDEDKAQVRMDKGRKLRLAVGSSMLRRVKEDQLDGLPTKTIYAGDQEVGNGVKYLEMLACPMPDAQRKRYDTVIGVVQEEQESENKGNPVLVGLHRLQDVSLHPQLLDGGLLPMPSSESDARSIVSESGKLQQTFSLLDEIRSRKEKVIIFAINKRLQSFLKVACERVYGIKVSIINGDTKAVAKRANTDTRKSLIADFEAAAGFGVIVMSPVAAGMGLTVVGANNVIHIQRHWNPAKEAQATDRVYRIGQLKPVNVYLPILQHPELSSFDVNLNKLLNQKSALKDAVVTPEEVNPNDLGGDVFGGRTKEVEPEYIQADDLKRLSWEQFEAFAVELYAAAINGDAMLTKQGTDNGADGLVTSPKQNLLIQAKHTESAKVINEDAAAQVYKAKPVYENNTGKVFGRLIAITNARKYSSNVRENAKAYKVELVTYSDIKKLLKKHPVDMKKITQRLGKQRFAI